MNEEGIGRSQTIADSDGMGNYLESYLNGIKEFHGNGRAVNPEFSNIKSECAYKLAEKINKREIHIIAQNEEQKQAIIEELSQLKADSVDKDEQKKRVIKKEEMKEHLGRSPDYLDMLIMGMWFHVQPNNIKMFAY
jgi:phenylpyruvate tautomerase PptA (4-oxalocrotonate tautomerase family)